MSAAPTSKPNSGESWFMLPRRVTDLLTRLNKAEFSILAMVFEAGPNGINAGVRDLAKRCGVKPETAAVASKRLEEEFRLIEVERGRGNQKSRYRPIALAGRKRTPEGVHNGGGERTPERERTAEPLEQLRTPERERQRAPQGDSPHTPLLGSERLEVSSSFEQQNALVIETERPTTTPSVPSRTQPNPEPKPEPTTKGEFATKAERWWTQEQFEAARQSLMDDFNPPSWDTNRSQSAKPDIQITTRILAKVANLDDWNAYLDYRKLCAKQTTKRSYGFYLADISEWQENRETLDAEVAELRAERERNDPANKRRHLYEHLATVAAECAAQGWTPIKPYLTADNDPACSSQCSTCAGFGRNPKTGRHCLHCEEGRREHNAAQAAEAEANRLAVEADRCPKCGHDGVLTHWKLEQPLLSVWCSCHHAHRRRQEEPGYVNRLNAAARKLWAMTKPQARDRRDNPPRRGMSSAAASIHGVLAAGAARVAVAS